MICFIVLQAFDLFSATDVGGLRRMDTHGPAHARTRPRTQARARIGTRAHNRRRSMYMASDGGSPVREPSVSRHTLCTVTIELAQPGLAEGGEPVRQCDELIFAAGLQAELSRLLGLQNLPRPKLLARFQQRHAVHEQRMTSGICPPSAGGGAGRERSVSGYRECSS